MSSPPTAPLSGVRATPCAARSRVARRSVVLGLFAAAPAFAVERPIPVSPGDETPGAIIEARCPTFSWAGIAGGARGYELAVLRASAEPGAAPELVTRATLPGNAQSWTPPLRQCLERGQRYAWSVAATAPKVKGSEPDDPLDWSPALLFEVEGAPSRDELEQAFATLQRHLDANGSGVGMAREPASRTAPAALSSDTVGAQHGLTPERSSSAPRPAPYAVHGAFPDGTTGALRVGSAASAPSLGTASLTVTHQIHLSEESQLFKDRDVFLWDDLTGNTALGRRALSSVSGDAIRNTAIGRNSLRNTTGGDSPGDGSDNTAVGWSALYFNTTGAENTAVGGEALSANTTGASNTAHGMWALVRNTSGNYNTAVGDRALANNTTGYGNTALGHGAGFNSNTGDNNIFIGSYGSAPDNGTIRIGSLQDTAFLAGDVGLGFILYGQAPENRLHVREAINDDGGVPGNHVAQIENSSTGSGADVLALKVGRNHVDGGTTIGSASNFITFFDGDDSILGEIQGNGTGGIALVSGNADFAEWLPRLEPAEGLEPGDVVGLHGAGLSKRTEGAARVFVISTAPIVAGNDPGEARRDEHARVALLGQVPVKVHGPVRAGELLIASGRGDGTAIAMATVHAARFHGAPPLAVGRALESSEGTGTSRVRAMVGSSGEELWASWLDEQAEKLRSQEAVLAAQARRIEQLEAGVAGLAQGCAVSPTFSTAAPLRATRE